MPSAIDPSQIPGKDIDPGAIGEQATKIAGFAGEIRDQGADVQKQWQGMSGVYSAPESGTVLGLMQPVSSQSTAVGDNLDAVAAALQTFATVVAPIKAELDALRVRAEAFGRVIAGGVQVRELNPAWINAQSTYGGASTISYSSPSTGGSTAVADVPQYQTVTRDWHEVQEYVDLNNTLIAEVNAQQVALWDAERECANKIRALYGAAGLRGYQSEHDPLGYGLDEIPEGTEMPWGAPVERTEGCAEATATFVVKDFLWEGILVGGVWGTVTGLGTLVLGYNPETGGFFSGDAYGAAWSSLGMLAAGLALNSGPQTLLFAADDAMEQFGGGGFLPDEVRDFKNSTEEAWLNTGKALIAWDKWEDDPGTALGESVFNVGTLLIPVGGAVVAGVKTASTAASVLSRMARVVDFVDPGAWAVNGALKLANGGFTGLGSLDNLIGKIDDATTNFDTPNIEVYTATDAGSALKALEDWGVDLDTVTARVDANGTNLLEFPGGAVELPAGTFDGAAVGGVRAGDGAADASIATPVREPELVAAGSVRGETGPGPVNTIVDEAPVRTETGGSDGSGPTDSGAASDSGGDVPAGPGVGNNAGGSGDDMGASGNGGTGDDAAAWRSSEDPHLTLTAAQKASVDDFLDTSRAAEPVITTDMVRIVGDHPGMRLEALDFRLKSDESTYRKASSALDEAFPGQDITIDAVIGSLKDSVRYTVVAPADGYGAGVAAVMRDLIDSGYQPYGNLKNSWGGDGYQGINSNWIDPASGRIIEVQFHTDSSFAAKTLTHELYELERLPGQNADTVSSLRAEQSEIFGRVDVPHDAADIGWPREAFVVHSAPDASLSIVDAGQTASRVSPEQIAQMRANGWMVAFFDDAAAAKYYSGPADTLGAPGRPFFVMPVDDAGVIANAHDAARYTGMSPATVDAYVNGGEIHGLAFPTSGVGYRVPTAADAMGWPHYLEGGHTAVRTEGSAGGYLVNSTREFVIPGGTPVMPDAVRFRLEDGAWIVERVW